MTRKLLLVVCSILLLGVIGVGAGLLGIWLLAADRSEAPRFTPAPNKTGPELQFPQYDLPLEITIEDVPEVPEEIRDPSPPIEEE